MNEASLKARQKYIKFIADWPSKPIYNGKNFKELFTYKSRVSLWWFTTVSMKNSLTVPIFDVLRRLEMSQPFKIREKSKFAYLGRLKLFIDIAAAKMVITLIQMFMRPRRKNDKTGKTILFCTLYSDVLRVDKGTLRDRCYADLPEFLKENGDYQYFYAPYLYGGLFSSVKMYLSCLQINEQERNKVVMLENYISWLDLFNVCFDFKSIRRYLKIEKSAAFRKSFDYYGTDIYPVIQAEMHQAFTDASIPRCVLTAMAYEKMARQTKIDIAVSLLELYNVGKAAYFGLKEADANTKTFAYQHGLDTSMNMVYGFDPSEVGDLSGRDYVQTSPMPDYFIFTGEMGKRIIVSCGYPESRCLLTGSPRYDRLAQVLKNLDGRAALKAVQDKAGERKKLLVTLSATKNDADRMIENITVCCSKRNDWSVTFKTHPLYDASSKIYKTAYKYGLKRYGIAGKGEDLYDMMASSDAVAVTYSTTGPEGIALHKEVILFLTEEKLDMSIFFELNSRLVLRAKNPGELSAALDKISSKNRIQKDGKERDTIIRECFYRLDGKAKERILESFERIS